MSIDVNSITMSVSDELKALAKDILSRKISNLVISMEVVHYMDSSGIGALVILLRSIKPGGKLILYGVNHEVQEQMKRTRLDEIFVLAANKEEAFSLLQNLQK